MAVAKSVAPAAALLRYNERYTPFRPAWEILEHIMQAGSVDEPYPGASAPCLALKHAGWEDN